MKRFFTKALQKNFRFFVRPLYNINASAGGRVCSYVCRHFVCRTVGRTLIKFDTNLYSRPSTHIRCEGMIFSYGTPCKVKKVVVLAYFKLLSFHSVWKTKLEDLIVCRKFLHISMPQCIIVREFVCYTKFTCQLKCSPLIHPLKSVKNIDKITY